MAKKRAQAGKKKRAKRAPALSPKTWEAWLEFVKQRARLSIYFCLFLTGALGLRCGEAVVAEGEDFALDAETPNMKVTGKEKGGQKSPGTVYVPKASLTIIRKCFTTGLTVTRQITAKNGCTKKKKETFKAKKTGFIFPSRKGATKKHMTYQTVYNVVRKLAPKFAQHLRASSAKHDAAVLRAIRPHSGRATFITQLMTSGMTLAHTMKAARHAPESVRVHLRYGQLTLQDVCNAMDKSSEHHKTMQDMTAKELRNTIGKAKTELRRRGLTC